MENNLPKNVQVFKIYSFWSQTYGTNKKNVGEVPGVEMYHI